MSSPPVLGVDIGGTKVAVGVVDGSGNILARGRKPMVADSTAEAALDAVIGTIDSMLTTAVLGGTFGTSGSFMPSIGEITFTTALTCSGKRK